MYFNLMFSKICGNIFELVLVILTLLSLNINFEIFIEEDFDVMSVIIISDV